MGEFLFRHRLALVFGFFGVAAGSGAALGASDVSSPLLSPPGAEAFSITGLLCLAAFALRASGEARLGAVVYGQDAAPRIVSSGPFRLMRHPLYAGTWLFFVAAAGPWLPLLFLGPLAAGFLAALALVAAHEEKALDIAHGDAWRRYAASVPRFVGIPRAVERDGLRPSPRAWLLGFFSNLGFLSLGLYRLLIAAGLEFRGLGTLNLACLAIWMVVVVLRRAASLRG